MISLSARVSLSAALVLSVFIIVTALVLERAFEDNARSAMQERLFAQLYMVMAAAEVEDIEHLRMPERLGEPRLNLPGSGLYARISAPGNKEQWHSPSALGMELPPQPDSEMGVRTFNRVHHDGTEYFIAGQVVLWDISAGVPLVFTITEDLSYFHEQMSGYRTSLWSSLGAMALLLLLAQAASLAWGLRPLRTVAAEVRAIESGSQTGLKRDYPKELRHLTDNINTLLHHERAQQSRYKNALADLAHSLKTPLAVLRSLKISQSHGEESQTINEQISRMDTIVQYQLQRAATGGRTTLGAPVNIASTVERLLQTLQKVYADKNVQVKNNIDPDIAFRGDESDLMELLGNLLDNAFKWCRSEVRITVPRVTNNLQIIVEDDGPGIDTTQAKQVLSRGVRLDETTPGHGVGLSMVRDIVEAYEGELEISHSDTGGARMCISLPGAVGS